MKFAVEKSLWAFEAWSGGKDTLDVLKSRMDVDEIEGWLEEICYDELPDETKINDILWFERDLIAEHLGYQDWEAYEDGWTLDELREAEDWYQQTDFEIMEKISGLKREDYSDEDGYQEFVDAVDDWWNGLSDKDKVNKYRDN